MPDLRWACFFILHVSLLCFCDIVASREWTTADNKFRVEAELVGVDGTKLQLRRSDGRVVTVELDKLSEADRLFVRESTAKKEIRPTAAFTEQLTKYGIKIRGSTLVASEEEMLIVRLRDAKNPRKAMDDAVKNLNILEAKDKSYDSAIQKLIETNVKLNSQLARVGGTSVTANNTLVGMISANESQVLLFVQEKKALAEKTRLARAESNKRRESYIQYVLDLRSNADAVNSRMKAAREDAKLLSELSSFEKSSGATLVLDETKSWTTFLRNLKSMEDTVLTDQIPLRTDGGNSYYVNVVINGETSTEMVLDSGASVICLPARIAAEAGITIGPKDPVIPLQLANGSLVRGTIVRLKTVRVGRFTVSDVECAILGPEAFAATPLLGMSFLQHFKFELNAQERTLSMVQIVNENQAVEPKRPEGDNLLSNGSFESDALLNWELTEWMSSTSPSEAIDTAIKKSGMQSLKLSAVSANDIRVTQRVNVKPGKKYRLTGWLRTDKVQIAQSGGGVAACVCVDEVPGKTFSGSNDWTEFQFDFDSNTRTFVDIALRLGHNGSASIGTCWFDDVALHELDSTKSARAKK